MHERLARARAELAAMRAEVVAEIDERIAIIDHQMQELAGREVEERRAWIRRINRRVKQGAVVAVAVSGAVWRAARKNTGPVATTVVTTASAVIIFGGLLTQQIEGPDPNVVAPSPPARYTPPPSSPSAEPPPSGPAPGRSAQPPAPTEGQRDTTTDPSPTPTGDEEESPEPPSPEPEATEEADDGCTIEVVVLDLRVCVRLGDRPVVRTV